jgi:galacturan 1,4-alpha-galacturonidase
MRYLGASVSVLVYTTLSFASRNGETIGNQATAIRGGEFSETNPQRPSISCTPKVPAKPLPSHSPRTATCKVESHNDGITDDSSYIISAFHSCNHGGHVVFNTGLTYVIGTALDLTFLNHIDIGMH